MRTSPTSAAREKRAGHATLRMWTTDFGLDVSPTAFLQREKHLGLIERV